MDDNHESVPRCSNLEACNLILADEKELEKLRGDAIGDTLYSESAVLRTLMCLSQFNGDNWSEEMEEQLCFLWDMTFEKDVVAVLMKHHFISLAYQVIQTSPEPRLVEILIGILGNMASVKEVRMHLSQSNYIQLFISLLSSSDALTLLQLVRLLNSCVWHVNNTSRLLDEKDEDGKQGSVAEISAWITHLAELTLNVNEHLSFILKSSTNEELLLSALELLNNLSCIAFKDKSGSDFLSITVLLPGLIEALHQLFGLVEDVDAASSEVSVIWEEKVEKSAHYWAVILNSCHKCVTDMDFLYQQRQIIMRSMCSILDPLILRENMFPLNSRKLDILDFVRDFLKFFQERYNYSPPAILPRLLTILDHLSPKQDLQDYVPAEESADLLDDEDAERPSSLHKSIYDYCLTVMCNIEAAEFLEAFGENPIPKINLLLSNFSKCKDSHINQIVTLIQKYIK